MITKKTLAESFCGRHGVPTEQFSQAVLTRCLYPQARLLKNPLLLVNADYFEPDLELIHQIGQLTHADDLAAEIAEYNYHPANAGRLRREWKLRLSVTRLQKLVEETFEVEAARAGSMAPFAPAAAPQPTIQPAWSGSRK